MIDRIEERIARVTVPALRVTLGLLWLANLHWKRPGDFGQEAKNGLYKYVDSAVSDPAVFEPYSWFVREVIIPNYQAFGWMTLIIESMLAGALIVGWKVRWWALIGAGMSLVITLSVLNYSKTYEWPWAYYMLIAAHLARVGLGQASMASADGLSSKNAHRGWLMGGLIAAALGAWAVAKVGWDNAATFTGGNGALLGNDWGELKFLRLNGVGGIVFLAIGVLGVAAWAARKSELALAAALLSALVGVIVLIQWRTPAANTGAEDGGWLGVDGGTLGAALGLTMLFGQGWWVSRRQLASVDAGHEDPVDSAVGE